VETDRPQTFVTRPLSWADLQPVFDLIAASELNDAGQVLVERSDIESDWSRPSTDLARDTVAVFEDGALLGYAEISHGGARAEAYVHPDARGRGIGSWLAGWTERTAARLGAPRVGQSVPEGAAPHRFLTARGYDTAWTSWVLELPEGASVPTRDLPGGYRLATAADDAAHRGAHRVIDTAFADWSDRSGQTFDEWASGVVRRSDFEPWMLRVVEHELDGVVGACFTRLDDAGDAFVAQLGVTHAHRGRGLAQVLLADGFGRARAHGADRSELTTDSRTGALDLYLKVGMVVTSTWLHLAVDPRRVASPSGP
jgi:mycothiol synthase